MALDYYFDDDSCEMVAIEPVVSNFTNEEAKEIVSRIKKTYSKPSIDQLIRRVSFITGVDVDDIMGRTRHRSFALARFALWYAIRARYHYSLPQIGARFNRDHSTIINGIYKAQDIIEYPHRNQDFCDTVQELLKFIDDAARRRG